MSSAAEIKFTIDDESLARSIVDTLLNERLIACAHRFQPVMSEYRWKNKREAALEWLVVTKTRADLADEVTKRIIELHSYDTPEVLINPIVGGNPSYLKWIEQETRQAGDV